MGEREKFAETVGRTKAVHTALEEAEQRRAYEYGRKKEQNVHELREKLCEIRAAYAPKVRLRFKEQPGPHSHRFIVDIGNASSLLRKPYGALNITASGGGFGISDRFPNGLGRYVPGTGSRQTVEQVADVIRDVAANYLTRKERAPYEPPAWMDAAVVLVALLVGAAVWAICGLIGGGWGLILGSLAAYIAFKIIKAIGPWSVLLVVLGVGYYLTRQ